MIANASDALILINQASLTVSPNTILGSSRSIVYSVSVERLQGVDTIEGFVKIADSRFEITKIESRYTGMNFIFTKNLNYSGDGTTAYFSMAQVNGFADTAGLDIVDITITTQGGTNGSVA